MRKFGDKDLVPLNPKLERTLIRIRKGKKEQSEFEQQSMGNVESCREGEEIDIQSTCGESVSQSVPPMEEFEKALRDYALRQTGIPSVIRRPTIQENNFSSWDCQMKTQTHIFLIS